MISILVLPILKFLADIFLTETISQNQTSLVLNEGTLLYNLLTKSLGSEDEIMNSNEKTRVSEGGLDESITHKLLGYIAGEFGFDNIIVPLTDASLTVVNGADYLSKHSKKLSKPLAMKPAPLGFHIQGLDQALRMQDVGRNDELKMIQSQKFQLFG